MQNSYRIVCSDELAHHGINGQRWGVKNGPPYPLDYESHSRKEKTENSKSEIGGTNNNFNSSNNLSSSTNGKTTGKHSLKLTDKQKKYIKTGAIVVGSVLAVSGTVAIARKTGISSKIASDILGANNIPAGKSVVSKEFVEACDSFADLNPSKGRANCVSCSGAGVLRLLGINAEALPDLPPLKDGTKVGYDMREFVTTVFKGGKCQSPYILKEPQSKREAYDILVKTLTDQGDGAVGMINRYIRVKDPVTGKWINKGHEIFYRVVGDKVQFFEGQMPVYSESLGRTINGFSDPYEQFFKAALPDMTQYARLDGLEIDLKAAEKFVKLLKS